MARLAFFGSPPVSAASLQALLDAGHEVAAVVSGPDRRRGRSAEPTPTPVKALALEEGLPVVAAMEEALGRGAELGVVVAFGRLIPASVLEQLPMVNLHFSLLPRWRGAAPVERAILAGDGETGVSLMALEAGLDTGGVFARTATPIGPEETAAELTARLGELGNALLVERLAGGLSTLGEPIPQVGEPTYASKITPEELELNFSRPAVELQRLVRVGRAWTTFRGQRLLVRRVRLAALATADAPLPGVLAGSFIGTGEGWLELIEVQAGGRAAQPFSSWALGARPEAGERFGA